MADLIPPILSDTPPPLDPDQDENEDFDDFRVNTDMGFDLSDCSRGSPDVWNRLSPNSEPLENKLDLPSNTILPKNDFYENDVEIISNVTMLEDDREDPISDKIVERSDNEAVLNEKEVLSFDKEIIDNPDTVDISKEIDCVPFDVESFDVELEARTSPEGADAESSENEFKPLDFQSFNGLYPEEIGKVEKEEKITETPERCDDDFADFGDFSSQPFSSTEPPVSEKAAPKEHQSVNESFDDFDDFECAMPAQPQQTKSQDNDIEKRLAAIFCCTTDAGASAECDIELNGWLSTCLDDSSSVWGHLKDLDISPALSMQWSSSTSSRHLLSALNVDSRNILLGQSWNPSIPRFGTPLEPIKAPDLSPPTPVVKEPPPPSEDVIPVPAAQFDWTSSGLTNPLAFSPSSLLDLDFLIKFDNVSSSPHAASSDWTSEYSAEKEGAPRSTELTLNEQSSAPDEWLQQDPSTDILLQSTLMDVLVPTVSSPRISDRGEIAADLISPPGESGMLSISSSLDGLRLDKVPNETELLKSSISDKSLSAEACRVVESLPDLSFLSARKLLLTANENLTRYHNSRHWNS